MTMSTIHNYLMHLEQGEQPSAFILSVVMAIFDSYDNINFFINRTKPYNPAGRNQTAEESDDISLRIKEFYNKLDIPYTEIDGDCSGYEKAISIICGKILSEKA